MLFRSIAIRVPARVVHFVRDHDQLINAADPASGVRLHPQMVATPVPHATVGGVRGPLCGEHKRFVGECFAVHHDLYPVLAGV